MNFRAFIFRIALAKNQCYLYKDLNSLQKILEIYLLNSDKGQDYKERLRCLAKSEKILQALSLSNQLTKERCLQADTVQWNLLNKRIVVLERLKTV